MRASLGMTLLLISLTLNNTPTAFGTEQIVRTHTPMRPLPTAGDRPLGEGPAKFVDSNKGDDAHDGSEARPWKSLHHALRELKPGTTLCLRAGIYHEHPVLSRSGTEEAPITIRSYPGELAVIDGGLPEFVYTPETAWTPATDGAPGEYISSSRYSDFDRRRVPHQFLPASWEPMWGKEEERPLALGNFADSMVPLHGYRTLHDLRSDNELWLGNKIEMREIGIYCGPGMWFNRDTGKIHIRLAHHKLAGLESHAYRGETDPRKIPLVVSVGFGDEVLRINGIQHVRLQDLVLRGATGSPMIQIYGSQNIALDHCTVFGGFPGLLIDASQKIQVTHSAFRGLAAPWTSRAHMKYQGTATYQLIVKNSQPRAENLEFAWCEFTDDHDFAFFRYGWNLRFHHNYVDNFNDDGLECGAKLRDHTIYLYQNHIGRSLIPFTQHEIEKDESPLDHSPDSGVFVYRNVVDLRGGVYKSPPNEPDPTGSYLGGEGHLVGDHGSPIWPVMHVYHNTFLRQTPVFRDYYLFGLGAQGLRNNERDVFNNIFYQEQRLPGVGFVGMKEPSNVREGGNLLWSPAATPEEISRHFARFRSTPLYAASQSVFEPGWTNLDRIDDPSFVSSSDDLDLGPDLRLQSGSPAIDAGVNLNADWPDPLREFDPGAPDIGAIPAGAEPWRVGIDGRRSIFDR
ncbi:MAG TPA: hypothetical protein VMM56_17880 [Planctomycetaceae bacterium]|nr:hypothetical protein [Planctomycetaceae bacterium]